MGNHPYLTNEQVERAGKLEYFDMTKFAQWAVDELLNQLEAKKCEKDKEGIGNV